MSLLLLFQGAGTPSGTASSDDFNRADDTDIDGSTMSGGGSWSKRTAIGTATADIATNQVTRSGADRAVYYDSTATDSDYQRVGLTFVSGTYSVGVMARVQSDGSGYIARCSSGTMILYLFAPPASFTTIDSAAGTLSASDTYEIEANGTTIKMFVNGVETLSGTDATHATGKPGLFVDDASAQVADDWEWTSTPSTTFEPAWASNCNVFVGVLR